LSCSFDLDVHAGGIVMVIQIDIRLNEESRIGVWGIAYRTIVFKNGISSTIQCSYKVMEA